MESQCKSVGYKSGLWDLLYCIAVTCPLFGAIVSGKSLAGLPGLLIGGLIGFVAGVASVRGLYSIASFAGRQGRLQSFVLMFLLGYVWSLGATFASCRITHSVIAYFGVG